jgi:predicted RNase H-like HicB family nuclease
MSILLLPDQRSQVLVEINDNRGEVRTDETVQPVDYEVTEPLAEDAEQPSQPEQLIARYIDAAVRRARTKQVEGRWYADIPILRGVWAEGGTEAAALDDLWSVTEGWVLFKIEDQDRDLPVIDSLNLNRL